MIEKNIVYSTDGGNFCPKCEKKIYKCICSNRTKNYMCSRPIFIEKQTAGRRGKPVNVIKNVPLQKADLKKLAKDHKALANRVAQQPKLLAQAQAQAPVPEKPPVQEMAFSLRTPPGKRAITVKVDSLSAVGGLVNPGDFVDIIAHLEMPDDMDIVSSKKKKKQKTQTVTTVLFQNLQSF